jgi:outer membrane protein TolC
VIVVLLALGIAWFAHTRAVRERQAARPAQAPVSVVTAAAQKGDLPVTLSGLGTVTPLATVTVKTQIAGRLVSVGFQEGQLVKAGDFLAQVDPRPYQIALDQARAQLVRDTALLDDARIDLTRYRTLAAQDSIPRQQLDTEEYLVRQYEGTVKSDEAAVAANSQIGVALAAYYPTVTLSFSGGFQSGNIAQWFIWPSRFWAVGPSITETVYDGGLRRSQTEGARAAYDAAVATYRQTVLTAFQGVEDNLAALRILEDEAGVQEEAVTAALKSVVLTTNQYKAGTVSYLNVITVQTIALNNQIAAVQILGRRMAAAVLLIQTLGGGWDASALPSARAVTPFPGP